MSKNKLVSYLLWGGSGFILGLLTMAVLVWQLMPGMMIVVHESRYNSVEETVAKLQEAVESQDWTVPGVRDMNKSMAKFGIVFNDPVQIVELCNARYASEVLATNPEVSTLIPCAWGVYQGKDGQVLISGLNMGLMGKMFGGTIAEVMGGNVAVDEQQILDKVVK